MIKEFHVDTSTGVITVTVEREDGTQFSVYHKPTEYGDGGPQLLTAAAGAGALGDGLLYFDGQQVINAGVAPQHQVWSWETMSFRDPRTPDTEWPLVRQQRSGMLAASDWTQLPDVPIATKEAWAVYRQALRDITEQPDPFNIVWPVAPA